MATETDRPPGVSVWAVLGWSLLAVLLVVAFVAAVGGLNRTVYGSSTFVERYLQAIADDDISQVMATPGVELSSAELEERGIDPSTSTALLRSGVIDHGPEDVRILSDVEGDDGVHVVTASYRIGTVISESAYVVRPLEPLYGVLNRWEFAESPLAVIDVTVENGALFQVGSLTLDTRVGKSGDDLAAFTQSAPYLTVAPAAYEFAYDSQLLTAPPVELPVVRDGENEVVVVTAPTDVFVQRVQEEVDEYLSETCATQPVLQPSGCPFGIVIDDRVVSSPQWSIVEYPVVTLTPGEDAFEMPRTEGTAHISVEVQSLFDGSFSQLEEDRPIVLSLTTWIKPDGSLAIELR
ncbi:hypothetical protein ARHIZOSPH14_15680 [Agromyces rhizosphaerae]|uniref:Uncharacterized protein n=1 Tax=Agromyces rhizosphaerae TaxID=88374 RepID=A0A9W6CR40_9MICO|nr:hypothetical protein [Agromyces rhizosphaerae]GLI27326.1 hypothetical protein ARHIZOSPH14_15680 [Agromyces rhizosphaerae]